jgi:hypothetical protein
MGTKGHKKTMGKMITVDTMDTNDIKKHNGHNDHSTLGSVDTKGTPYYTMDTVG